MSVLLVRKHNASVRLPAHTAQKLQLLSLMANRPACQCPCASSDSMANLPADQIFEPDQLRRCECRLCGNGRCAVFVHPIASLLATRLQREDRDPVLNMLPVMCEDCLEHFLLERKRDAVKRSREKTQIQHGEERWRWLHRRLRRFSKKRQTVNRLIACMLCCFEGPCSNFR